jgi:zinc-ribbon domain
VAKYCSNCGTEVGESGRFCSNCGAAIAQDVSGPQPVNQNNDATPQEFILPIAELINDGVVYTIPHSLGTQRAGMKQGTKLEVVKRTKNGNWLNVTYVNSIGRRTYGWIPTLDVKEFTFCGNTASMNDLEISKLEFNNREELAELEAKIWTTYGKQVNYIFKGGLLLFFASLFLLSDEPYLPGAILLAGIAGWFILSGHRSTLLSKSVPSSDITSIDIFYVNNARKSVSEIAIEQQQQMALLTIAGSMATRLVPDVKVLVSKK